MLSRAFVLQYMNVLHSRKNTAFSFLSIYFDYFFAMFVLRVCLEVVLVRIMFIFFYIIHAKHSLVRGSIIHAVCPPKEQFTNNTGYETCTHTHSV